MARFSVDLTGALQRRADRPTVQASAARAEVTAASLARYSSCGVMVRQALLATAGVGALTRVGQTGDGAAMVSLKDYRPLGQLRGREGSAVMRAESPDGAGPVVIKVLRSPWLSRPDGRQLASETIERWRRIAHQGFVLPIRVGWSRDGLVLISPFIGAGSLEDRMRDQALSSLDIRQLAADISDALEHAHARGLTHGNVKPSNILFDEEGQIHITDFCLGGSTEKDQAIKDGNENGWDYSAPEVRVGDLPTAASDQYSFALVLLTLLTRKTPLLALDWLTREAASASPASSGTSRESNILPTRAASTFRRALMTSPTGRYPSVDAFHRAFEYAMGFSTEPVPLVESPSALARRTAARPRPRRTAVLASALAVAACLAISVPVLSSPSGGTFFLDGVRSGDHAEEPGVSSPGITYTSTPTVPGDSGLQPADRETAAQTNDSDSLPVEPSDNASEPLPADPETQPPTVAPSTAPATVMSADSPTPFSTQEPPTPTSEPGVNPRSCKSDPDHPRYCTPTPEA